MRTRTTILGGLLLATAAGLSAPAYAGGIGVITRGGLQQQNVYVYDDAAEQFRVEQARPMYGVGIQGLLGDRDDRVIGLMRLSYHYDAPSVDDGIEDAARAEADANEYAIDGGLTYATPPESGKATGVALAGVEWGLLPDPGAFQVNLISNIGAAVLTPDASEYVLIELGGGARYALTDTLQINGELTYDLRIRKGFSHAGGASLGVRYMFD